MTRTGFLFAFFLLPVVLPAQNSGKETGEVRLRERDVVKVSVQGEPDVTVERQVDGTGQVNVPLLGSVKVAGLTITHAQQTIAEQYMKEEIFIRPEVVLTVVSYAPKVVTILGQVGQQGKISFPADASTMSVVEAIAAAGGLTRIAKGDAVRVTRRDEDGAERAFTLNIDKMIEGRGDSGGVFKLQPDDVVFVPERVF